MSKMTDAQKRAHHKYDKKTYKRVVLCIRKEYMPVLDAIRKRKQISQASLFFDALKEQIKKETGKTLDQLKTDLENGNAPELTEIKKDFSNDELFKKLDGYSIQTDSKKTN